MHYSLLVASPLVVVCLVLPGVPATAQSGAALIERNMLKPSPAGRCPWEEREGKPAGCTVLH
jgi:hypothetical protein